MNGLERKSNANMCVFLIHLLSDCDCDCDAQSCLIWMALEHCINEGNIAMFMTCAMICRSLVYSMEINNSAATDEVWFSESGKRDGLYKWHGTARKSTPHVLPYLTFYHMFLGNPSKRYFPYPMLLMKSMTRHARARWTALPHPYPQFTKLERAAVR